MDLMEILKENVICKGTYVNTNSIYYIYITYILLKDLICLLFLILKNDYDGHFEAHCCMVVFKLHHNLLDNYSILNSAKVLMFGEIIIFILIPLNVKA